MTKLKFIKDDAMQLQMPLKNTDTDFEWWYFDASSKDGTHIVVMFSVNDTRLVPKQPSIRFNAYYDNGESSWECEAFDRENVLVNHERCNATFDNDQYCIDKGDHYEIYTKINGNGCKLKFYPLLPHHYIPESETAMGWTIAVPHARVEGVIYKDNKEISFKGDGYHDHNWGATPMSKFFKSWYWGKIHTEDFCIDYGLMIPKGDAPYHLTSIVTIDGDGTILCEPSPEGLKNSSSEILDVVYDDYMECEHANKLTMLHKNGDLEIKVTIDVERIVMREKAEKRPAESAYRYVGKEHTVMTRNGEVKEYNTSGLHEIVYLYE